MAKRKPKAEAGGGDAPARACLTLAELKADPANPRKISERARGKLAGSLKRFGDLAGITFNRRTGELVTGHQRVGQIRAKWPAAELVTIDEATGLIVVDEARAFVVRFVDWSPAEQRAANVTANNPKLHGEFTEDVRAYLLDVHEALDAELPLIAERVLLQQWLMPEDDKAGQQAVETLYQVIAYCDGEDEQTKLAAELAGRGLKATAVVG